MIKNVVIAQVVPCYLCLSGFSWGDFAKIGGTKGLTCPKIVLVEWMVVVDHSTTAAFDVGSSGLI